MSANASQSGGIQMTSRSNSWGMTKCAAAAVLIAALHSAPLMAADVDNDAKIPIKALKTAKPDVPFFFVNDNLLTYSYIVSATDPGVFSVRPDGSINGKTEKQVYSFTHFDAWAYGTNFFTISMFKSDHNDPASPCTGSGNIFGVPANCAGSTDVYGLFRSTFGWNQMFDTKAFSIGPLHNISFEVGMDAEAQNSFLAPAKRDVVAGLQFAFDLPYKGYFNAAPLLYYQFSGHVAFLQCGLFGPGVPGVTCLADGNITYKPTWAVETNYYMDLGFLPENMQYFSISGRAGWYGPKGPENSPLPLAPPGNISTAVEFNSEPIRLTFDASKAIWGTK